MDVVDSGQPPRAPRGLVIGVAAALVAGGLALSALRDEPRPPPAPVAPTAAASTAPAEPVVEPRPLVGATTTEVRGRAVVVHGGLAFAVDLATGMSRPVVQVPHDVRDVLRVGRTAVLLTGSVGDFPPVTSPVYAVRPDLGVRRIGDASTAVPDVEGTGIWVTRWGLARQDEGTVSHVGLDGRVRADARPLRGQSLDAAVRGGLVVSGFGQGVALWQGERLVHAEPGLTFVAASPGRLLWGDEDCARRCSITWWDMPNDFTTARACRCGLVETPPFPFHAGAELSPDGRLLAVQTTGRDVELHVCTVATSKCVSPSNAVSTEPFALSWTADGSTLVVATSPRYAQLAAWRPGWPELRLVAGSHPAEAVAVL